MLKNYVINFPKGGVVYCRFWEDECVVYNQRSGETHLVDGMGVEIFKLISEKTTARAQVLQNIQSVFELEMDFDVEGLLDNLILEYQKLGLLNVMENNPA
ncbi:MAG: HPr-rel-A system PqqD family peptide chaperone [Methylococcaceae bacterium]|nr:HPr-rel-A system PqqD family peptide chaperone [Methylococcaceae bacterium]